MALRARRRGLRFELFNNVRAAYPFDDLVLRVLGPQPALFLMQLKHYTGEKKMTIEDFVGISEGTLKLSKFFEVLHTSAKVLKVEKDLEQDEKRLRDQIARGEACFLLYTTRDIAEGCGTQCAAQGHETMLLTGSERHERPGTSSQEQGQGQGQLFCFGSSNSKVWNSFSGKANEEQYHKEFLPRFKVFCRQSLSDDLKGLIRDEIVQLFGGEMRRTETFLQEYLAFLKSWALNNNDPCALTETTPQLQMEGLLAGEFRERARARLQKGMAFQDDACAVIRQALAGPLLQALRVAVPGVQPGLRAAKIVQVLEKDFSGRWTYVDQKTLRRYPAAALAAAASAVDVLVLDVEDDPESARELLRKVTEMSVCVVQLCSALGASSATLLHGLPALNIEDNWSLQEMTEEAQEILLSYEMTFQGSNLKLRELEGAWPGLRAECDGELLGALLRGDAALGSAPPPAPDDACLYIPRFLEHRALLDPRALLLDSPAHHLTLSNVSDGVLQELGRHFGEQNLQKNERWTVLLADSAEDFRSVCKERRDRSVHWVHQVGGRTTLSDVVLVWRGSRGQEDVVAAFVRPGCELRPLCVHADAPRNAGTLLLLGEAGVGKTTFLRRAAEEARKRESCHWVVFVQLLSHSDLLEQMPEPKDLKLSDAEKLVAAAAGVAAPNSNATAARRCLHAVLTQSGAVSVYVDGVDEIAPAYKDKVLRLLSLLQRQTKTKQILVSSRPEVKESLCRELCCVTARLRPLSRAEQERYLCARWGCGVPTSHIASLAADTVTQLTKMSRTRGTKHSVTAVPLHVSMAADIWAPATLADSGLADTRSPTVLRKDVFAMLDLYNIFVQKKFQVYLDKHFKGVVAKNHILRENFDKDHEFCAMRLLLLHDMNVKIFEEYVKTKCSDLQKEKTGIFWIGENGDPQFAHFSFCEFFGARWLFKGRRTDTAKAYLRSLYQGTNGSLLLRFFELMLLEREANGQGERLFLHEAILGMEKVDNSDDDNSDDENSGDDGDDDDDDDDDADADCLEWALAEGARVDAVDAGGRLALHLAARRRMWNYVKVLLEKHSDSNHQDDLLEWTPIQYLNSKLRSDKDLVYGYWYGKKRILTAEALVSAGADIAERLHPTYGIIMDAARNDCPNMLRWALSEKSDECHYKDALLHASRFKSVNALRVLLEKNGDCGGRKQPRSHGGEGGRCCALDGHHAEVIRQALFGVVERWTDEESALIALNLVDGQLFHVDDRDDEGRTLLHIAVERESLTIIDWLLQGGSLDTANNESGIQNDSVVYDSNHEEHTWKADKNSPLLPSSEEDPNLMNNVDEHPPHLAVKYDLAQIAKRPNVTGTDTTAADEQGREFAHSTAESDALEYLVQTHDSNSRNSIEMENQHYAESAAVATKALDRDNEEGHPPVQTATAAWSAPEVKESQDNAAKSIKNKVSVFTRRASLDVREDEKETRLHLAKNQGHSEIVNFHPTQSASENTEDQNNSTPPHLAAKAENVKVVNVFLVRGASVDSRDKEGRTPLHLAAQRQNETIVNSLLAHGASVDSRDKEQLTPLYWAALSGYVNIVNALLARGASVDSTDKAGRTSLYWAAHYGDVNMVNALLARGASVDCGDEEGKTPLHVAAKGTSEEIFAALLARCASKDSLDCGDKEGRTPLFFAAESGNENILNALLAKGASVDATDKQGRTPLLLAAEEENHIYTAILAGHASVFFPDKEERTRLLAAKRKNENITKALLAGGASLHSRDKKGRTPLVFAMRSGNNNIINALPSGRAAIDSSDNQE